MGKPDIGGAAIPTALKDKKKKIEKLTVLREDSKESIYSLIFSEPGKGNLNDYE